MYISAKGSKPITIETADENVLLPAHVVHQNAQESMLQNEAPFIGWDSRTVLSSKRKYDAIPEYESMQS